jgi:hypothetical protein
VFIAWLGLLVSILGAGIGVLPARYDWNKRERWITSKRRRLDLQEKLDSFEGRILTRLYWWDDSKFYGTSFVFVVVGMIILSWTQLVG